MNSNWMQSNNLNMRTHACSTLQSQQVTRILGFPTTKASKAVKSKGKASNLKQHMHSIALKLSEQQVQNPATNQICTTCTWWKELKGFTKNKHNTRCDTTHPQSRCLRRNCRKSLGKNQTQTNLVCLRPSSGKYFKTYMKIESFRAL